MPFPYIHNLLHRFLPGISGVDGTSSRSPSVNNPAPLISVSSPRPASERPQTGLHSQRDLFPQPPGILHDGRGDDDGKTTVKTNAPKKRARFDIDDDSEDFDVDRTSKRRHAVGRTPARVAVNAEASDRQDHDPRRFHQKSSVRMRQNTREAAPREADPEQSLGKGSNKEQYQPAGSRTSAEKRRSRNPDAGSFAARFKKVRIDLDHIEGPGADAPSATTIAREPGNLLPATRPVAPHSVSVEEFMANVPPVSALRGNQEMPPIMGEILYGQRLTRGTSKAQNLLKPLSLPEADPKVVSRPEIARQTKLYLNQLKKRMPRIERGELWSYESLPKLDSRRCPNLGPVKVEVINADTFDAAESIAPDDEQDKPVYVLNMANAVEPGSAWQRHAAAQEEELCRRSSLIETLLLRHYPLADHQAIYSPYVSIFRSTPATGYRWLDGAETAPEDLPMVSVVTIAALERPATVRNTRTGERRYRNPADRETMKLKMRLILRLAAWKRHRQLVLGAFGCGAFRNPVREVANCWKEVLQEREFAGWFDRVAFGILDPGERSENWAIFREVLQGLPV